MDDAVRGTTPGFPAIVKRLSFWRWRTTFRWRLAAATVTSALVLPTVVAGPALAAASACNSGYSCFWGNRDYSGSPWHQEKELGKHNVGYWDNDETSSVWNRRSGGALYLYNASGGSSDTGVWCVPRGYAVPDLDKYHADDRVSSYRITTENCGSGTGTIGGNKGT